MEIGLFYNAKDSFATVICAFSILTKQSLSFYVLMHPLYPIRKLRPFHVVLGAGTTIVSPVLVICPQLQCNSQNLTSGCKLAKYATQSALENHHFFIALF